MNQQEDRPALSQATHSRPPAASGPGNFGGIEEGEEVTRGSVITRQTDSLRRQLPREVTPRLQRGQTPLEADAQSMQTVCFESNITVFLEEVRNTLTFAEQLSGHWTCVQQQWDSQPGIHSASSIADQSSLHNRLVTRARHETRYGHKDIFIFL